MGIFDATVEAKWFFQFVFCAVSLAIVWGTTLERIKYGVYVIYAIIFSTLIYPIGAHWVFGGGWLQANIGMQDFAGSTAVHLIGATGGLAVLLLLGARKGKYGGDGKPRPIPGHSMPLFGLGVLILWLGWFGFNPGTALGVTDGRFAEIVLVTQLACCRRCAHGADDQPRRSRRRSTSAWSGTARSRHWSRSPLRPATSRTGRRRSSARVAGVIVVYGILAIDKVLDDPVGALSAHGLAGIWGTLSCGIFTAPRLSEYNAFGVTNGDGEFLGGFVYAAGLLGKGANDVAGAGLQPRGVRAARCPGARCHGRVRVRVRGVVRHVLRDQEDLRSSRHGGRGGGRARHLRARHVRLPGAVHPPG